jgi:hypothetical protein
MIVPDLIKAVESGWEKSRLEGLKIQGKHRMNERIREVWIKAAGEDSDPDNWDTQEQFIERFAELIVQECTAVLFDESERLYGLYLDENNWDSAEEYEIRSNQCIDDIALIEKHFGVEE